MRRGFHFLISCLIFCFGAAGWLHAQGEGHLATPQDLALAGRGQVVSVIDGDTLVLADGREVRLTGIQAPKLPLGRPNFKAWPLSDAAKAALEDLALNRAVSWYVDGNGQDRYRRLLAHVVTSEGTWLQGAMVEQGLARVYTFPDNRHMGRALLDKETAARRACRGIWALNYYRIHEADPQRLEQNLGTFQLIEGRVLETARVRNWTYINFGDDYRTDFTVSVNRKDWKGFEEAGLDLLALAGHQVRVRGWLKDFNGPLIEVTHPEQIEILAN